MKSGEQIKERKYNTQIDIKYYSVGFVQRLMLMGVHPRATTPF